jgi:anti-sigma factor RsiW
MASIKADNKCRRIRTWLNTAMSRRLGSEAGWLQSHVASCPRCRRRLASWGKVDLALSFIKAQPHRLDLLMRANAQAICVLKHSLREEPKAQELKRVLPQPKPLERYGGYGHSIGNLAACVTILILMKIGVFSSMDTFQTEGQKVIKQYYCRQIGQDLADEVFPT